MVEDNYIERKVDIHGKKVVAKYHPNTGEFHFGKESWVGTDTTPTKLGAFETINALKKSFSDLDMPRISYSSADTSLKKAVTKDKLYARALKRAGYEEKENILTISWLDTAIESVLKKLKINFRENPKGFRYDSLIGTWLGPKRVWIKREDKKDGGLEKVTAAVAIAGILGGLFFLSPNMTGNAIANISQSSGNILGAVLLVVGLVAGFFWVTKK